MRRNNFYDKTFYDARPVIKLLEGKVADGPLTLRDDFENKLRLHRVLCVFELLDRNDRLALVATCLRWTLMRLQTEFDFASSTSSLCLKKTAQIRQRFFAIVNMCYFGTAAELYAKIEGTSPLLDDNERLELYEKARLKAEEVAFEINIEDPAEWLKALPKKHPAIATTECLWGVASSFIECADTADLNNLVGWTSLLCDLFETRMISERVGIEESQNGTDRVQETVSVMEKVLLVFHELAENLKVGIQSGRLVVENGVILGTLDDDLGQEY